MLKLTNYIKVDSEIELKKFLPEFSIELFHLIESNRLYLKEFLPWLDMCESEKDELKFIDEMTQRFVESRSLDLCIFYKGKIAGAVGTHEIDWSNRKTSLGYWIGQEFQGHGIVTRSCKALINYLFNNLKLKRIEIYCATNNFKSQRIAEKLGFEKEGILRSAENLYGKYIDLVLYSLIS